MYTLEELKPLIIEWANERDLIHSENADKQRLKLIEECGELASAILKNDIEKQKDGIGDIFVVLTILSEQINIPIDIDFESNTNPTSTIISDIIYFSDGIDTTYSPFTFLSDICIRLEYDLTECANLAYNEIKNRKGVTKNGTFIKDSTPSDYIMD